MVVTMVARKVEQRVDAMELKTVLRLVVLSVLKKVDEKVLEMVDLKAVVSVDL